MWEEVPTGLPGHLAPLSRLLGPLPKEQPETSDPFTNILPFVLGLVLTMVFQDLLTPFGTQRKQESIS